MHVCCDDSKDIFISLNSRPSIPFASRESVGTGVDSEGLLLLRTVCRKGWSFAFNLNIAFPYPFTHFLFFPQQNLIWIFKNKKKKKYMERLLCLLLGTMQLETVTIPF